MAAGATKINRLNFLHFLIPVRGPDRRDRDPICITFCGGKSFALATSCERSLSGAFSQPKGANLIETSSEEALQQALIAAPW